jgi:hypothetical protein
MTTTTININMDKTCPTCNEPGLLDNGRCLKCTVDELLPKGPTREFKKIKVDITTKHLELVYSETVQREEEFFTHDYTVLFKQEVHEDLVNAIGNFIPHLAVLVELKDVNEFNGTNMIPFDRYSVPGLASFEVSSISTGGEDEHFGLTISGRKKLRSGKVFNINTPFTKFEGGEHEEPYEMAYELRGAFDVLVKEVGLFLDEGKAAPSRQTKLDFEKAA